jgi:hypothetical protein
MKATAKKTLIGLSIALILTIGLLFLFNSTIFWHIHSPYKTPKIIYRNKKNTNITIEFQMQDSGALGYNRRIVKVTKGIIFNSTEKIDTAQIDKTKWILVNEYVNEMGIKGG